MLFGVAIFMAISVHAAGQTQSASVDDDAIRNSTNDIGRTLANGYRSAIEQVGERSGAAGVFSESGDIGWRQNQLPRCMDVTLNPGQYEYSIANDELVVNIEIAMTVTIKNWSTHASLVDQTRTMGADTAPRQDTTTESSTDSNKIPIDIPAKNHKIEKTYTDNMNMQLKNSGFSNKNSRTPIPYSIDKIATLIERTRMSVDNDGISVYKIIPVRIPEKHQSYSIKVQEEIETPVNDNTTNITNQKYNFTNTAFMKHPGDDKIQESAPKDYSNFLDNTNTVTACCPLSPQLLNCPTTRYRGPRPETLPEYRIDYNHTLFAADDDRVLATLGDYFVDSLGNAIVCADPIHPEMAYAKMPRCNVVTVHSSEFLVLKNGSWWFNSSGALLNRPEFLVKNHNTINMKELPSSLEICWPLSIAFINCPIKVTFSAQQIRVAADNHLIISGEVGQPVDQYFMHNGMAFSCLVPSPLVSNFSSGLLVCYIASCVCLLLTAVNQVAAPSRTRHSRCLLCHVTGMLVMYVGLSIARDNIGVGPCYVLYVVTYMGTLSALFWLNVMAFDVCHFFLLTPGTNTWLNLTPAAGSRFTRYCFYAWGVPVILCILSVVVDQTPSIQRALAIFPGVALQCWLNGSSSLWAFYYGPMTVLMSMNLLYFVLTVVNLRRASQGTDLVNRRANKQLFTVCVKLFAVMGLPWIASLTTWSFSNRLGPTYIYVTEILTSLQGVAVSLVYMSSKKNIENIRQCFRRCSSRHSTNTRLTALPKFIKSITILYMSYLVGTPRLKRQIDFVSSIDSITLSVGRNKLRC